MASQVSPGIVLKERDLSNAVIVGAQQITAGFASTFQKGPINQIVNINSQKQFIDVFGKPSDSNAEDWFVASEFLSYGGRLAVVRAATTVLNASTDGGFLIQNDLAWESGATLSEVAVARTAGTWGNKLAVYFVDRGADQILTLASVPAEISLTVGTVIQIAVASVEETVNATIASWNATTKELAVVLANPNLLASVGDTVNDDGAPVSITAVADWYSNAPLGETGLTAAAVGPRPGTSNFAASYGIKYDEVHVAVVDTTTNTIVEKFNYLSKLSDGRSSENANTYYRTVINEQSTYIFTGAHPAATLSAGGGVGYYAWGLATTDLETGDIFNLSLVSENNLSGGTDDYSYNSDEIGDAYDRFLDTEETTIDFVLMGGSMDLESDTKQKASKVIAIAASRKDCVAFVSPHKGNQIGANGALTASQQKVNTINFFNGLTSTSYAVFDSGYKYYYDRFNDKYRYLPCNGDVAGLCVATSSALDDWYSPAGLNRGSLRNAVKLAYNPNKADRDELYQSRINPIVSFSGSGVTLFGDKTALASPSAFDRINVRRLFLNVEKRVEGLAKQVLFEQNDETTRASFSSAVNSYMAEIQARRGVTDFLVVCDETNNTPDVIDRNEFVAELYIKPTRSINYVTVTFTATKTGVAFAEVIGQ
jgi:hypothetical protein